MGNTEYTQTAVKLITLWPSVFQSNIVSKYPVQVYSGIVQTSADCRVLNDWHLHAILEVNSYSASHDN